MGVYAHPDDESTCAGGVLARHAKEGARVIVVTCTNGEFGDGPGGVKPGEKGHDTGVVAAIRRAELDAACWRLGVSAVERLGYHDSGMPGWGRYARGDVFSDVPVDAVSARVAQLLDMYQPDVVLTHNATASHEHADHQHAARATALAVEDSGIPVKLYFSAHGAGHWQRLRDALAEADIRRPAMDPRRQRALALIDEQITTKVDVSQTVDVKRAALFEHVSQLGSSLAARLSPVRFASVFATESFIRVRGAASDRDLFA
jgi:LmbE family N-acetylglucosaminyl deacetylase